MVSNSIQDFAKQPVIKGTKEISYVPTGGGTLGRHSNNIIRGDEGFGEASPEGDLALPGHGWSNTVGTIIGIIIFNEAHLAKWEQIREWQRGNGKGKLTEIRGASAALSQDPVVAQQNVLGLNPPSSMALKSMVELKCSLALAKRSGRGMPEPWRKPVRRAGKVTLSLPSPLAKTACSCCCRGTGTGEMRRCGIRVSKEEM
jgi:hypothetical protein